MEVLIVTARPEVWHRMSGDFAGQGLQTRYVSFFSEALDEIASDAPDLLILDPEGQEADAEALREDLIEVLMVDASILTAVVSGMEEEAFHDAMEGLGVLFMFPPHPGKEDIYRLGEAMAAVRALGG